MISDKNGLDSSDDANGLMLAVQEAKARRSNVLRRNSEVQRTKV
ncbi:hypothetical protein [Suicoccus acidiformans]|nr:hypothetical protein [Suicoccus acidiformans]